MTVAETIHRKLSAALDPDALEVVDESHLHAGHAGAGIETHFRIRMTARAFAGKSRLARQREVHGVLADELAGPVHALTLILQTPEETAARRQGARAAAR